MYFPFSLPFSFFACRRPFSGSVQVLQSFFTVGLSEIEFCLNLKYLGWPYRAYIKISQNDFLEELLSENEFEAVLATFCCYDHGAKASEAVQKIAADQKEYRKCSSCVIIC